MLPAFFRDHGSDVWRPLRVTSEPTIVETDPGGYSEATVPCELSPNLKRRLEGADLRIDGMARPFFGRIDDVGDSVHAWGWQVWTDDKMRGAWYCEDALDGWKTDAGLPNSNVIQFNVPSAGPLQFIFPEGQQVGMHGLNVSIRFDEVVDHGSIVIPWTRQYSALSITGWARDAGGNMSGGLFGSSVTSPYTEADSSGTVTAAFSNARSMVLLVKCESSDYTPASTKMLTAAPTIYAVTNAGHTAAVTTITPYGILKDSADKLGTDVLPAGENYRAFLSADSTALGRMVFPMTTREREIVAEVCKRVDMRYGWWSRIVGRQMVPVPVSEPHETTASYHAVVGPDVKASLNPKAFKDKAKVTRLGYRAVDGTSIYEDITDTDITHRAVQLGIDRYDTLYVNTSSAALARAATAAHQAEANKDSAPGTVEITGRILENGRLIMPCDIEAGKLITLDRTEYGTVTDRITQVEKVGRSFARLTLLGAPIPVSTAIRRLVGGV